MRRIAAALLVPLAACAVLAGCGSAGSSGSAGSANSNAAVKTTGSFDMTPTVAIPKAKASTKLVISTPIKGTGTVLKAGNSALVNYAIYKWTGTTHTLIGSTFGTGPSSGPQIIPAQVGLPGLTAALKGAKLGSRIVAVLPPKYGYGTRGQPQYGITGSDTLVWVIDLLQQFSQGQSASGTSVSHGGGSLPTVTTSAGQAPVVAIPKHAPPAKLSVTTLIKGTGPKTTAGETVVVQYVGVDWQTGKVFGTSWPSAQSPSGSPLSFTLGGKMLAGWNQGLAGIPVGSRVMLVIPPALGYGAQGQPNGGIGKNATLVFVVDILAVHPANT
ncbi:MAG: FKBP-type peptidyl-prolyl cis-trans isomerase [Streptosporangiaceae bacterium]